MVKKRGLPVGMWLLNSARFAGRAVPQPATCQLITSCKCPHGGPFGAHDAALETVCGATLINGVCPVPGHARKEEK